MYENAIQTIQELVRNRTPVRRGMAVLLDRCNRARPFPVWKSLLRLDYENNAARLVERFREILADEPPSAQVNGLWFGFSARWFPRDNRTSFFLCLTGSTRFDPQQSPPEWASGPSYVPEERCWPSLIVDEICRALNGAESDFAQQGEYVLCLGYASLAIAEWCRGPMRTTLLADAPIRAVAVGFDSGDGLLIDVLRKDDPQVSTDEVRDEASWLSCKDPEPMLAFMRGKADGRKLRLFAVACCRRVWHLLKDERSHRAVEVAEGFADGVGNETDLEKARRTAREVTYTGADCRTAEDYATSAAVDVVAPVTDPGGNLLADRVTHSVSHSTLAAAACDPNLGWFDDGREAECLGQAHLLRDILGNPFRPVSLAREWLTPAVVAIARTIYEERRFADMPVLADAMEETGCNQPDVICHCRQGGEHARGCWLLDAILGQR